MAPRPPLVVQKCSNCDWQKLLVFLGFSLALRVIGAEEPPSSFAHQMTRWLSPASRMDGQRVSQLEGRLGQLPPFSPGHSGHAKGFHSRFQPAPDTPLDLTIDLGQAYEVDRIAIFPVQGMFRGAMIKGYGFPEQFVVELSQERGFSNPVLALDSSLPGAPPRPDYPRQFVLGEPVLARYLRLRVLNHWRREDGEFLSAFGEVMVLSEGRNVALYADVEADSFTTLPDWYRDHLVDGQTDLGLPVSPEPSPSNGFLSRGARQRFTEKWVQVELPRLADIEEVSLIPAQPVDAPDQFGHGFPRKFRLLVSEDPEFERSKVIADYSERLFPNPGDNPVVFPAGNHAARFIRLEVTEMWHISTGRFSLPLAEMEVFEDRRNIAIGAQVTASDVFVMEDFLHVWRPEYLVDGYSSQNRLITLQKWLEGLEERWSAESQITEIRARMDQRIERTLAGVLTLAIGLVSGSIGLAGVVLIRRKHALAQQKEVLRARIARDLHDDLGSRLGGMRLLSENLLLAKDLPADLRSDLDLLHRSSGEATDAMRDIVWLLDSRERSLEKLRQQMKRILPSLVGTLPVEFSLVAEPNDDVEFAFRRELLLAFRESLSNAVRHSGTDRIACRVGGDEESFWFEVRDWGRGFEEEAVVRGQGLANLRKRAESLGGMVRIESSVSQGTVVTFSAPYRRNRGRFSFSSFS